MMMKRRSVLPAGAAGLLIVAGLSLWYLVRDDSTSPDVVIYRDAVQVGSGTPAEALALAAATAGFKPLTPRKLPNPRMKLFRLDASTKPVDAPGGLSRLIYVRYPFDPGDDLTMTVMQVPGAFSRAPAGVKPVPLDMAGLEVVSTGRIAPNRVEFWARKGDVELQIAFLGDLPGDDKMIATVRSLFG